MMRTGKRDSEDYARFCFDLYRDALRISKNGDGIEEEWVGVTKRMWLQASQSAECRTFPVVPRGTKNESTS